MALSLFVFLALPSPLDSLAPVYPLSHSPLLSLLASATPLPPSLSLSLSLLLARLIDPDPVLFSSLFDSRRVTRAPTHPPPHDGKGCPEREKGWKGWRRKREAVGGTGRTGPTHRSRDIHFHFIFLARYRRQRKKERRRQRIHGKGSGKISAIPPRALIGWILYPVRASRKSCESRNSRYLRLHRYAYERKSRDARIACALHSCDCCIGKEIMRERYKRERMMGSRTSKRQTIAAN